MNKAGFMSVNSSVLPVNIYVKISRAMQAIISFMAVKYGHALHNVIA